MVRESAIAKISDITLAVPLFRCSAVPALPVALGLRFRAVATSLATLSRSSRSFGGRATNCSRLPKKPPSVYVMIAMPAASAYS